jgi:hypothetical protein
VPNGGPSIPHCAGQYQAPGAENRRELSIVTLRYDPDTICPARLGGCAAVSQLPSSETPIRLPDEDRKEPFWRELSKGLFVDPLRFKEL